MLAKSPWDFSSLRNPALSAPSYRTDCPSPHLPSQTFPGLVPTWSYLLLRSPEQDSALQVCSHHLPQPAGDCLTKASQDILGFRCLQEHLAGLCRVSLTQHPNAPGLCRHSWLTSHSTELSAHYRLPGTKLSCSCPSSSKEEAPLLVSEVISLQSPFLNQ